MKTEIPKVYFYFDSKNIFNILTQNSIPELYDCYDKGDEFVCNIRVENNESLKLFFQHLKEKTELNLSQIEELTDYIWAGYAFDILTEYYGEEKSNKIIDDCYNYLVSLFESCKS